MPSILAEPLVQSPASMDPPNPGLKQRLSADNTGHERMNGFPRETNKPMTNGSSLHKRVLDRRHVNAQQPSVDGISNEDTTTDEAESIRQNGFSFDSMSYSDSGNLTPSLYNSPVRDDGYFAAANIAEIEDGRFVTRVRLDASENGEALSVVQREREASSVAGRGGRNIIDKVEGTIQENGQRAENISKFTLQTHRISSPPAFQTVTAGANAQPAPRLQHRHTLEVPRVASSRTSRDISSSGAEDGTVATGRNTPNSPARRRGSMTLVRRATRSIHSDLYLDEVPQDEEAARWAEAIRAKRASRRRRRDEEDDERVVMGTKVDQNHVNYVAAYNMLTGIRFTVSRTNAKLDRDLTDADFEAKQKFSFDVTGNELTPSAKYDFKFKDYAPWVFRHLRSMFRLDPGDYLMSLTSKYILSELGSPGKSGSFFYFSRDYKYIIKTIHRAEHKFLRRILKDYYNHVSENPNTLLSQFYGLHRVKAVWGGKKIYFVVMNNLFPPHRDIHRTFDLKGSTIGRDFKEEDLTKNPRATLKDLNWLRRNLSLEFGPIKRKAFVDQMERDVKFLQRNKIMDYSLLIGIHDLERGNKDDLRNKTLQVFQPGGEKEDDRAKSNKLARTPSKLENAKKAKELRHTLRTERPVPLEQTTSKMPDQMEEDRKGFYFYRDDGGFRATHEDNSPGEEIYYLGIIDCLTHYNLVKRLEHFFKGITNEESQISAIPPQRYGDRFVKFISGTTKSREEMEQAEKTGASIDDPNLSQGLQHRSTENSTNSVIQKAEAEAEKSRKRGSREGDVPDRRISAVRSPSADRGDPGGFTLPVVEEAAESQSLGGRSGHSNNDMSASIPAINTNTTTRGDEPRDNLHRTPPTPPKEAPQIRVSKANGVSGPWLTNGHGLANGSLDPPTPPRDHLGKATHNDQDETHSSVIGLAR